MALEEACGGIFAFAEQKGFFQGDTIGESCVPEARFHRGLQKRWVATGI